MSRKSGRTAEQTRDDVAAAARTVLVKHGLRAVSAATVGELAGVAASTALEKGKIADLLARMTVSAFMPLLDEFEERGSTHGWLVEAEHRVLKILRADPTLPLAVTQTCGLVGEPPRKPGHLNHFSSLYRNVAKQLAAAFARDREDCDSAEAGKRLLRFYTSAALHLSVWPNATDDDVIQIAG